MSKALAIDFSTSNTGYAFRNPLTNEYVVGSIAGGKSKDPLELSLIHISSFIIQLLLSLYLVFADLISDINCTTCSNKL